MSLLLVSASLLALQAAQDAPPIIVPATPEAEAPPAEEAPRREEIVITGHYVEGLDLLAGTSTIDGETLQREMKVQIGDTLASLPGVSATSFTPGASRPVLRGYQGSRIRVLNDGLGAIDVSNTSADHAVTIDPLTAEKIEVLRGPAVLLFGSEAIGGAVNVIDHRLPRSRPEGGIHVDTLMRGSTADNGLGAGAAIDLSLGEDFVAHLDGSISDTGDLSVGNYVMAKPLRDELLAFAADAAAAGEEDAAADALAAANARGKIANTSTNQKTAAIGLGYLGSRVQLGLAASLFDTRYGIPSRPATSLDAEVEDGVSIDLNQKRLDLRANVDLDGFLDHVETRFGIADYEHRELEGKDVGTTFLSTGHEGRIEFHQAEQGGLSGVFGGQYYHRSLDAIGEEAFVPANTSDQWGVFVREDYQPKAFGVEGALRLEGSKVDADSIGFSRDFTSVSGALGARYELTDATRIGVNASRTARAPSAEELLSDGPHVATQSYELGNPDLVTEKAWGTEAYVRHEGDTTAAALTVWANWFDDFIYSYDNGDSEDGLPVFETGQQGANWWGVELEAGNTFLDNGRVTVKGDLVADYVRATLDDGNPVPRIPPLRVALGLETEIDVFSVRLEGEYSAKQDRVSAYETPTDSHLLVGASLGYKPFGRDNESVILLSANNLFDVDARRHASFTKDFAPLAGRDIRLSARFSF